MYTDARGSGAGGMLVVPLDELQPFEHDDGGCTTRIACTADRELELGSDSSHFIVVQKGELRVEVDGRTHLLGEQCYGSFRGAARVVPEGSALIVSSVGYHSQILMGGPIEERGRLRYVDGCTTSLLLAPPVRGEPCLNFMHLPQQIAQTMHTHPSLRVGLILSGNGRCETEDGVLPFTPGTVFFIPPNTPHSFQSGDETLRIVIYHPDSDVGPTHTDHTMLNRTFVEGQSAQFLTALHTGTGALA